MGDEIRSGHFGAEDHRIFRERLQDETKRIGRWFDEARFDSPERLTVGFELEAWLVDGDHLPAPHNEEFIATANDPRVVAELSRFNFELNGDPRPLDGACFQGFESHLNQLWDRCDRAAATLRMEPVAIGILPMVRDEMLQPAWMSGSNRYRALNDALFAARQAEPWHIRIVGAERLDYRCDHIMLEAACTSLQTHLKVAQQDAVRFFNAATIAAAPLVAITANSPFLYGRILWEETRIAAFEQATEMFGFRDAAGRNVLRTTLGTGYLKESMFELFAENLRYPTVLPEHYEASETLPHLRLQNGTIWRWNRPILGFEPDGTPHLRIEQRATAAAPSIVDNVANLALGVGLMLALGRAETPPESRLSWEEARENFYGCARYGLRARVRWNRRKTDIRAVLREELLPAAAAALKAEGVDAGDVDRLFAILDERAATGRTGSEWQRRYYRAHNRNFQALTDRYIELQRAGLPVHQWPV